MQALFPVFILFYSPARLEQRRLVGVYASAELAHKVLEDRISEETITLGRMGVQCCVNRDGAVAWILVPTFDDKPRIHGTFEIVQHDLHGEGGPLGLLAAQAE